MQAAGVKAAWAMHHPSPKCMHWQQAPAVCAPSAAQPLTPLHGHSSHARSRGICSVHPSWAQQPAAVALQPGCLHMDDGACSSTHPSGGQAGMAGRVPNSRQCPAVQQSTFICETTARSLGQPSWQRACRRQLQARRWLQAAAVSGWQDGNRWRVAPCGATFRPALLRVPSPLHCCVCSKSLLRPCVLGAGTALVHESCGRPASGGAHCPALRRPLAGPWFVCAHTHSDCAGKPCGGPHEKLCFLC